MFDESLLAKTLFHFTLNSISCNTNHLPTPSIGHRLTRRAKSTT